MTAGDAAPGTPGRFRAARSKRKVAAKEGRKIMRREKITQPKQPFRRANNSDQHKPSGFFHIGIGDTIWTESGGEGVVGVVVEWSDAGNSVKALVFVTWPASKVDGHRSEVTGLDYCDITEVDFDQILGSRARAHHGVERLA